MLSRLCPCFPVLFAVSFGILGETCARGDLLVVNSNTNSISQVDAGGNLRTFASTGMDFPLNIARSHNGDFLVSNGNDGTIHRFAGDGTDLGTFAAVSHAISGLAIDRNGHVFAGAWYGDGTIREFSNTGEDLGVFASVVINALPYAFGPANFFGLAIDSQGHFAAADDFFGTMYRFAPDGSLLSTFPQLSDPATRPDGYGESYGITFDREGNIYVGYWSGIRKFSPEGFDLGDFAGIPGVLVTGLTFDRAGNLYASLYDLGVVEKYAADGTDLGVYAAGLDGPIGLLFTDAPAVPEPGTMALAILAGLVCAGSRTVAARHRRRAPVRSRNE